ncbi:MAG: TlyA family RNA methyltransferase [Myxococcales bacterium]|nr:TlyA family RNA methyltransferase [Myxococcales bacterium]
MAAKGGKVAKARADVVVVRQGLAPDIAKAAAMIMAGEVLHGDHRVDKPGVMLPIDAALRLRAEAHDYVSRGALKLAHALDVYKLDVAGAIALDVGASTGGFTEVLLRRGAARVYAIDVGYGQLAWSLQQDPRVVVMDRQHIRDVAPAAVAGAQLAVIDVSFISLGAVLPAVAGLLADAGAGRARTIIALIKPQFELPREALVGGVAVRQEDRDTAVASICAICRAAGWTTSDVVPSPITGPAGNIEYLLHIAL